MCCKQNLLSFVALNNLQLLFYCLQPIIVIHGLDEVRECQRFGLLKLSKFVICSSVGGGGRLALLLLLFSLATPMRVLAI
jgi:hypothetical protein